MHKLAKGLKKKKKGKKSKHKEEELFKPEELEAYRREHAAVVEEASAKNEEWKNFLSLTSGVDDVLKKTQDDLDRIKSTSFFQRIPPPSETEREKKPECSQNEVETKQEESFTAPKDDDPAQLGIVPVSESETEEEEDDDIFDTTYIDAIAAGEVKLAYIPESPTEKQEGDDPFDTSIAERAILGPAVERKGKKLVPLGAAVEVLTGRVQLPTCATKPVSNRRQILKQQDLLLESFDNSTDSQITHATIKSPEKIKTLLDDDEIPLPDEPIDLSKTLYIPASQPVDTKKEQSQALETNFVKEFEDDEDKEFEALAAESLTKSITGVINSDVLSKAVVGTVEDAENWKPFDSEESKLGNLNTDIDQDDPFDTTFAEKILPGKAELKLIERDILENDADFDPRAPAPESTLSLKGRIPESQLKLITPVQRDLLGGSTSDLSKLGDTPIQPTEGNNLENIKYCDPFDTSLVDTIKAPGQAELKFLEKELLGDIKENLPTIAKHNLINDDEFDPRRTTDIKSKERTFSRPDILNVSQTKTVSFAVPNGNSLLDVDDTSKVSKPLTPFYARKSSVPGVESSEEEEQDPFDTSFVPNLVPGRAELKLIENELFNTSSVVPADNDFDPRDENKIAKVAAVEAIKKIVNPKSKPDILPVEIQSLDLLSASEDISAKVLTPVAPIHEEPFSYADPFDTSIATNILPGKAELKLLENELIQSRSLVTQDLGKNKDLLVHNGHSIIENPLSPDLGQNCQVGQSFEVAQEDYDPFDTSFAGNIQPTTT